MTRLLFVGDGERDRVTVPRLVEGVLAQRFDEMFRPWARLHQGGKGYQRKLRFAVLAARGEHAEGMVVTLDSDKAKKGSRLAQLQRARNELVEKGKDLPMALGEATPHGEAWLLDDAVAVQRGLGLSSETPVPNPASVSSAKHALEELMDESPRRAEGFLMVWAAIAREVRLNRCRDAQATGYESFVGEVRRHIAPLFGTASDSAGTTT